MMLFKYAMFMWMDSLHDFFDELASMSYELSIWGYESPKPMIYKVKYNKGFQWMELSLAPSELEFECVSLPMEGR